MDQIPEAKSRQAPPKEEKPLTVEQRQRMKCIEAVKKINDGTSLYGYLTFGEPFSDVVCDELVKKGYHVTYTLNFDSKKNKKTCSVCIKDPMGSKDTFEAAFGENFNSNKGEKIIEDLLGSFMKSFG
jgi:hypothetical protein